jgi:uncharacterized membrane protein
MAETILFFAVAGLGLWLFLMRGEVAYLRRRVSDLEDSLPLRIAAAETIPEPVVEEPIAPFKVAGKATTRRTASVIQREVAPPSIPKATEIVWDAPALEAPKPKFKNPLAGASFEDLVGGKLPIWIGGIALVFAGFFLVRYTIEAGLLGPGARSILATLFALTLIALSEFGGRLPKIGESFTADPRVAQSLAGAGVATLYGTLYMASEIYGLIGVMTAFLLVIVVTAIAFTLALRHGPPTALMGLAGGFAAPWVAGMGASNLPTLLLYLAVFIAALFGLAVWRRWLWLLVLASGGGALWSFAMLLTAENDLAYLGLFVLVSGAAAVFALDRFGQTDSKWKDAASYAPMALALVQLAMLLPQMNFSIVAWGFFGALSVLAIAMAWRETRMALVMLGALLLAASPLAGAWTERGADTATTTASLVIILLFAGVGHFALWRDRQPALPWAFTALGAPMLVWFTAAFSGTISVSDAVWGSAALAAAAVSAALAWVQHRQAKEMMLQRLSVAATVLMVLVSSPYLIADEWIAVYCTVIAMGAAAWAWVTGDRVVRGITIAPLAIAIIATAIGSYKIIGAFAASLAGDSETFTHLPEIGDTLRTTLIPSAMALAMLLTKWFRVGEKTRLAIWAFGGAGVTAFIWLIAKQPAAIQSPSAFIRLGFAERAIFTQILFALSWLALSQAPKRPELPALRMIGWALVAVAVFRVVWFDLILLNPVMRAQMVGPIPIANLATGHMALVAIWMWLIGSFTTDAKQQLILRLLSLGSMILTVLVSVRQALQGSLMSGGTISTAENYLYSAGLLLLAIAWLVRGMMAGSRLLRMAGLALLTAVTLKVFLIDAAALTGLLRILSFLGLGIALIGIGWAYGRVMGTDKAQTEI